MGFLIGLIVNFALLSIPLGGTLGALFGIRPFESERKPLPVDLNALVVKPVCKQFNEFAQNKIGFNYTGQNSSRR